MVQTKHRLEGLVSTIDKTLGIVFLALFVALILTAMAGLFMSLFIGLAFIFGVNQWTGAIFGLGVFVGWFGNNLRRNAKEKLHRERRQRY